MAVVGVSVAFLLILSVVQASGLDTSSRECPPFWTRFKDNCYRFFGTPKNWQAAENYCQKFFTRYGQGHLASVSNQEENKFLQQLWSSSLVPNGGQTATLVWIGMNDIEQEGRFVWSDGSYVGFTQWNTGQPDNANGLDDCVQFAYYLDGTTAWNDMYCDIALPHICQISSV